MPIPKGWGEESQRKKTFESKPRKRIPRLQKKYWKKTPFTQKGDIEPNSSGGKKKFKIKGIQNI